MNGRTLPGVFPEFAIELEALVGASDRPALVAQVPSLLVVDRCTCGDEGCAHFYTAERPRGAYGLGHSNLVLASMSGMVVLDVVGDTIVAVEVLNRPDVKALLDGYLPVTTGDPIG